jgi:hypothetical protein
MLRIALLGGLERRQPERYVKLEQNRVDKIIKII